MGKRIFTEEKAAKKKAGGAEFDRKNLNFRNGQNMPL